jgi:hypothetical protein
VRNAINEMKATLFFALLDVQKNGVQIVIEFGRVRITNLPNLVYNRIVHGNGSKSSSGVQIMGALSPWLMQTASMIGRIVAFARCLQFHVNK